MLEFLKTLLCEEAHSRLRSMGLADFLRERTPEIISRGKFHDWPDDYAQTGEAERTWPYAS